MLRAHNPLRREPGSAGRPHVVKVVSIAGVAATAIAGGIGAASAATSSGTLPTVNCPVVSGRLAGVAIPASAQAEVSRNLALLNTQMDDADRRIASSVGQGGPNFVQNAILGPLTSKRVATLDRITIAIGRRGVAPQGLSALATCTLNASGRTGAREPASIPLAANAQAQNGTSAGRATAGGGAATRTVNCPDVSTRLAGVTIPASAQAEVNRNLALLNTQISDADRRIASSVGQGGPNFVQNAILGPLTSKRVATLDRITIAIGRRGVAPQGLSALATCTLNG